jgi:ActR/RegA family two-component response regulator
VGGLEALKARRLGTVMLVDNDQRTLNAWERDIRLGFASRIRVLRAPCRLAAISFAHDEHVDLAIVDQHLDDTLGTDLLPELRALAPNMLTILTSADLSYDDARRAGEKTLAALPKPRSWRRIIEAIQSGEDVSLLPLQSAVLSLDSMERAHIARALRDQKNNVVHTAEVLGMDRSGLQRKLKKLGITIARTRSIEAPSDEVV